MPRVTTTDLRREIADLQREIAQLRNSDAKAARIDELERECLAWEREVSRLLNSPGELATLLTALAGKLRYDAPQVARFLRDLATKRITSVEDAYRIFTSEVMS